MTMVLPFWRPYRAGVFFTANGNEANFLLNNLTGDLRYSFVKNFSISMEWGRFQLQGNYRDFADVHKQNPFVRLAAGISLF